MSIDYKKRTNTVETIVNIQTVFTVWVDISLIMMYALCFIVGVHLLIGVVYSSVASQHECNRRCVISETPKTCVYNFTVEWYRTLSKACYECPFNITDCYRPHCVAADGNIRAILAINRMMPGPSIEVCEDDTVIVNVKNRMEDGGTVSLHWHGLHQYKTPYMDGAPHVTQCAINVKEEFRYEFKAKPAGTHWYHSHTGMQVADGVLGAFIVRKPQELEPARNLYQEDLSEHIIILQDWLPAIAVGRYINLMHNRYDSTLPTFSLINGRAKNAYVSSEVNTSVVPVQTPFEVFNVNQNTSYRFRVVGALSNCPMKIAIEGHEMIVIATDGMSVEPKVVGTMIIHTGERYDFVIKADAPVDNYPIRVWGLAECRDVNNSGVYAILHYNGSSHQYPDVDMSITPSGQFLNPILSDAPIPIYTGGELNVQVDELRSSRIGSAIENYTEEVVDLVYFLAFDFNNNDNKIYNHPAYYPVKNLSTIKSHFTPVVNNITFDLPPIPLLSQPEDVQASWFCNRSSLDMTACFENLCICTHLISVKLNQTVDMVLINEGKLFPGSGHPMHLHGHSFRVLGIEKLGESAPVSEVENLEKEGGLKRNLINPPWKDTIIVPDGAYVIIRIIANNPGYWFFHCHLDIHMLQGMAMLIKVGEDSDVPKKPENFPRCGGMGFTRPKPRPIEELKDCITNSAMTLSGIHALVFILAIIGLF